MARLAIKTEGLGVNQLDLKLGLNRIGRDKDNDFILEHPTISSVHCELILSAEGVVLHDCQSTNGTFINGYPVSDIWLEAGQQLRLGDVEMLVESTEAIIAVPKREVAPPPPPPPVVLDNGNTLCPRHPEYIANFNAPSVMNSCAAGVSASSASRAANRITFASSATTPANASLKGRQKRKRASSAISRKPF